MTTKENEMDVGDAMKLLLDIPEETPAVIVEEAAHDVAAELERLQFVVERQRVELTKLRARDEAAKAVLEEYAMHGLHRPEFLADQLDALARAHDEDGGQDR